MSSVNERNKVSDEIGRLVCKKFDSGDPYGIIADALHLPYRTYQSILAIYKKLVKQTSPRITIEK